MSAREQAIEAAIRKQSGECVRSDLGPWCGVHDAFWSLTSTSGMCIHVLDLLDAAETGAEAVEQIIRADEREQIRPAWDADVDFGNRMLLERNDALQLLANLRAQKGALTLFSVEGVAEEPRGLWVRQSDVLALLGGVK